MRARANAIRDLVVNAAPRPIVVGSAAAVRRWTCCGHEHGPRRLLTTILQQRGHPQPHRDDGLDGRHGAPLRAIRQQIASAIDLIVHQPHCATARWCRRQRWWAWKAILSSCRTLPLRADGH